MSARLLASVGVLCGIVLAGGCAGAGGRVGIPTGHWTGQGLFVAERWSGKPAEGVRVTKLEERVYKTTLSIEPAKGADGEELRVEILSQRGPTAGLDGDRTHFVLFLKRNAIPEERKLALYRITRGGLSLDAKPPDTSDGPEGPTHASCMRVDGDLVLKIEYMAGFVDVYRFRGDVLYKDGVFASEEKEGLLHWSEVLHRVQ